MKIACPAATHNQTATGNPERSRGLKSTLPDLRLSNDPVTNWPSKAEPDSDGPSLVARFGTATRSGFARVGSKEGQHRPRSALPKFQPDGLIPRQVCDPG